MAVLASDRSASLADLAMSRVRGGSALGACVATGGRPLTTCDAAVADGMALPYRHGAFDAVISIAVLHHISSPERRVHMLTQLLSLLRPGGRALVTVWATEQENKKKLASWMPIDVATGEALPEAPAPAPDRGGDYFVPWHLPLVRTEAAAAATASSAPVDNGKQAVVFRRYYHLFTREELVDLVEQVPGARVRGCFYDKDNWCCEFESVS